VPDSPLSLTIDPEALRPLIEQTVRAVLARLEADRAQLDGRLAYSESEAAALLGLHAHQLRDERLRGRIQASVGPGRKILYTRQDLMDYLLSRRWEAE
jgi:hypothetical protein